MKVYNTLTKKIEPLIPNHGNEIKMYTCGPTVYDYAHIGNLRTYIFEDILEKSLNYLGYSVIRTMNITDVGHLANDSDDGDRAAGLYICAGDCYMATEYLQFLMTENQKRRIRCLLKSSCPAL